MNNFNLLSIEVFRQEITKFIEPLGLMDSVEAAKFLGVKPQTMRANTSKYKRWGVKIGRYWFWRKVDLERAKRKPTMKSKNSFDDKLKANEGRISPDFHQALVNVIDTLDFAWAGVQSVFGEQAAPEQAIEVCQMIMAERTLLKNEYRSELREESHG